MRIETHYLKINPKGTENFFTTKIIIFGNTSI
jgi:hypothetical protein